MNEHYHLGMAGQITIPAYLQTSVLDFWHGAGLMTIETHWSVFERQSFMAMQGHMEILIEKLLIYILNLTAELANLQKIMIIAFVSITSNLIIHEPNDSPCTISSAGPGGQSAKFSNNVTL